MASTVRDKDTGNKAEQAKEDLKDSKEDLKDSAKHAAEAAKDKAGEVAENAKEKAEGLTNKAGRGVENLGEKIREKGPDEGIMGKATSKVADALETSGEYLQEKGLKGIGEDITDVIRNNPVPAVLIGIGVGFLLAKATGS